jgi:hypothetical protein
MLTVLNISHLGTLYDNEAGQPTTIQLQLRDYFRNKLITGGRDIEGAILGVSGRSSSAMKILLANDFSC